MRLRMLALCLFLLIAPSALAGERGDDTESVYQTVIEIFEEIGTIIINDG